MKRNLGISALFIVLAGLMFLFAACGGGGGSSHADPPPIEYTGLTTQVVVDDTNAEELAIGAFEGGSMAGSMGDALSYIGGGGPGAGPSPTMIIQNTASQAVGMVKESLSTGSMSVEAIQEFPFDPVPGNCGGLLEISMEIDDVTLEFNGSFNYRNFCNNGETTNGKVGLNGTLDLLAGGFSNLTMTFYNLTSSSAVESYTIAGTMTNTVNGASFTMSMNIKVQDLTGKVHWVKDYELTAVPGTDLGGAEFADITITSGRFYHPDHGYVDIQTEAGSPLRIYDTADNPSSGVLVITGSNSSARLVCSPTYYEIYVDNDGDGFYDDWYSGQILWTGA